MNKSERLSSMMPETIARNKAKINKFFPKLLSLVEQGWMIKKAVKKCNYNPDSFYRFTSDEQKLLLGKTKISATKRIRYNIVKKQRAVKLKKAKPVKIKLSYEDIETSALKTAFLHLLELYSNNIPEKTNIGRELLYRGIKFCSYSNHWDSVEKFQSKNSVTRAYCKECRSTYNKIRRDENNRLEILAMFPLKVEEPVICGCHNKVGICNNSCVWIKTLEDKFILNNIILPEPIKYTKPVFRDDKGDILNFN
jgi:hypothetical protein